MLADISSGDGGQGAAQRVTSDNETIVRVVAGCFLNVGNDHVTDRCPLFPEAVVDVAFVAEVAWGPPLFEIFEPIFHGLAPTEGKDHESIRIVNGDIPW